MAWPNDRSCEKLNASFYLNRITVQNIAMRSNFINFSLYLSIFFNSIDCFDSKHIFWCCLSSACFRIQVNSYRSTRQQQQHKYQPKHKKCCIFPWESLFAQFSGNAQNYNWLALSGSFGTERRPKAITNSKMNKKKNTHIDCEPIQKQQQHSLMCVFCTFIARLVQRLDRDN